MYVYSRNGAVNRLQLAEATVCYRSSRSSVQRQFIIWRLSTNDGYSSIGQLTQVRLQAYRCTRMSTVPMSPPLPLINSSTAFINLSSYDSLVVGEQCQSAGGPATTTCWLRVLGRRRSRRCSRPALVADTKIDRNISSPRRRSVCIACPA